MVKVIIFDLGNVIVNANYNKLFNGLTENSSKPIPNIKKWFEDSSFRKAFERGKLNPKQFYEGISAELSLKVNFNDFKKVWCNFFTLNKDVAKLIKNLKKNFKLILLSNTDTLHFNHIKNKYKIINSFDDFVLSYEVGCRKPNPMIYIKALRKAKTFPFNCLYFDDIPQFVYVARLMGIRAFQYKNFEELIKDLRNAKVL